MYINCLKYFLYGVCGLGCVLYFIVVNILYCCKIGLNRLG